MPSAEVNAEAARSQLEKVLVSPGFARNERLSRFLRFIVERHLEGQDRELKETLIAIGVFGRKPDYDPKLDSIVRTEATRLRARLTEYYAGEGSSDPVIIELPKGGYVPVISGSESEPAVTAPLRSRLRKPVLVAIGAAVILAAAAIAAYLLSRDRVPVNIAVLPMENLGHDPANDYFVDGLTAEIIRNLSVIEGLQVRSQTSSFTFRGKPRDIHEAGKLLDADYIVEGSVLRANQRLRIDAQLVRVRDDSALWSGKFDRELTDVFAIQEEISRGIVNNLRLKLGRGRRRYETSTEAYDLYLQARSQGVLGPPVNRTDLFEKAIAKDPLFAPAYAGLASEYTYRWRVLAAGPRPDGDWMQKTRAAADKAIELDPLLGEAHAARGLIQVTQCQWEQAEKSFRRAIELDPGNSDTRGQFASNLLITVGRIDEAVQEARAALKMDPLSPSAHGVLAFVLLSARHYDEAAQHATQMGSNQLKPITLARARVGQGRIEEAIRLEEEDDKRNPNRGVLGYAYGKAGRRAEAEKLAAEATQPNTQVLTYAGLGDKDRTFEALDRMAAISVWRVGQYLTYPELSLLRSDSRLKSFRKKIGLPE